MPRKAAPTHGAAGVAKRTPAQHPAHAGRLARVQLADVPLEERRKAAQPLIAEAARHGGHEGLWAAVLVTRAVLRPEETHLVPEAAVEAVLGHVPNGNRRPRWTTVEIDGVELPVADGLEPPRA